MAQNALTTRATCAAMVLWSRPTARTAIAVATRAHQTTAVAPTVACVRSTSVARRTRCGSRAATQRAASSAPTPHSSVLRAQTVFFPQPATGLRCVFLVYRALSIVAKRGLLGELPDARGQARLHHALRVRQQRLHRQPDDGNESVPWGAVRCIPVSSLRGRQLQPDGHGRMPGASLAMG